MNSLEVVSIPKISEPGPKPFCQQLHSILQAELEAEHDGQKQTFKSLAARAGIHVSLWSKYLQGDRTPDTTTIHTMGEGLGLTPDTVEYLVFLADLDRVAPSVRTAVDQKLRPMAALLTSLQESGALAGVTLTHGDEEVPAHELVADAETAMDILREWFPVLIKRRTFRRLTAAQPAAPADWTRKSDPNRQQELVMELAAASGVQAEQLAAYVQGMNTFIEASKGARHS